MYYLVSAKVEDTEVGAPRPLLLATSLANAKTDPYMAIGL